MRVLHVLHMSAPALAGYTIRTNYIFENLKRQGVELAALTSVRQPEPVKDFEDVEGVPHWRTPRIEHPLRAPFNEVQAMVALARRLDQVVKEWKPDVVHAHSPVLVGLPALGVCRKAGIPLVYEVRDLWENASVDRGKFAADSVPYKVAQSLDSIVLKGADAVVTICESLRAEIEPRSGKPVTVVANGVDIEAFVPDTGERLETRPPTVAYIGAFQPYEGIETLIEAFPLVVKEVPNATLVITGSGGVEQQLRQLSERVSLPGSVTFTGRVPHHEVGTFYQLADVLVYPRIHTRTTSLTTPLKPLEGMAMGKAVVVSDLRAMRELVRVGETGLAFTPGSRRSLADVLIRLLREPDTRSRLGVAARAQVTSERQWSTLVSRYPEIYERVARKGRWA